MIKYIILILFVLPVCMSAQIVTDRPDQTESSSTVPKGGLQIEAGFLFETDDNDGMESQNITAPGVLLRYGLFDGFELRLGASNEMNKVDMGVEENDFSGLSDIELGAKVEIIKDKETGFEFAFLTHVSFPTGAEGITADEVGSINKLAFSHEITESIGMGYNIGYCYFGEGNGDIVYSFVIGFSLTDEIGFFAEPYGTFTNIDVDQHISMFNAGFTYLLQDNLQLDLSSGWGQNRDIFFISTGVSWLIGT